MRNLAIMGASYLQLPLIETAKQMGLKTHVFAWRANDVGETAADVFYPISITETDEILKTCREIGIDGICSIGSDLAMKAVNYVAEQMNLPGNSMRATAKSTDKHLMRLAFAEHGDPSVQSLLVSSTEDLDLNTLRFPVIVKPLDRSGSRGITKLETTEGLSEAIEHAKEQGFIKQALVEEFAEGKEYSVECLSVEGKHHLLGITEKFTTGAPGFIETGHIEPACFSNEMKEQIRLVVFHALDSLELTTGASHTELKVDDNGNIRIIEIGGRMGGDFIGSDLVRITSGIDFVKAVISCALGETPDLTPDILADAAAVRFIFQKADIEAFQKLQSEHPDYIVRSEIHDSDAAVHDSSDRHGYFLMMADRREDLLPYLPKQEAE
ncbi:MAG: ATP-grasp domain-containing protein [Solobacterium sp.]|nr:ATP-grasp domain-containing protein [Solobacterium sp.]